MAGWDVYLTWVLVGVAGSVGMTVLNVRGVRMAAVLQTVVVGLILLVGLAFILGSVFSGNTTHVRVDLSGFSAGMYFYQVRDELGNIKTAGSFVVNSK